MTGARMPVEQGAPSPFSIQGQRAKSALLLLLLQSLGRNRRRGAASAAAMCSAARERNVSYNGQAPDAESPYAVKPMPQHSAGILLYRRRRGTVEVLLVHPGGPLWAKKDDGAWSIPKGVYGPGEDALTAAKREFAEETGAELEAILKGEAIALGAFVQSRAKIVEVWAVEGELDPAKLKSNTFTMQWPPRSGRMQAFREVDRAAWFAPAEAETKILEGQQPVLEALLRHLKEAPARRRP